jgi:hypothetical protein
MFFFLNISYLSFITFLIEDCFEQRSQVERDLDLVIFAFFSFLQDLIKFVTGTGSVLSYVKKLNYFYVEGFELGVYQIVYSYVNSWTLESIRLHMHKSFNILI